jgi:hypothetical protein
VIVAHSIIERSYGLLIALKPGVEGVITALGPDKALAAPLAEGFTKAFNDGLSAINQQRDSLKGF